MNEIFLRLHTFLTGANKAPVSISEEVVNQFGESCKAALRKQFTDERKKEFTLRMSNLGKNTCQLQAEKLGVVPEDLPYNFKIKMILGDLAEALVIVLLKSSGCNVQEEQTPVTLTSPVGSIKGTLDAVIDGMVYIKTASPYAFATKFQSADYLMKHDDFGYGTQGYGYALATGRPFGGWIVVEKSTGDIKVVEVDPDKDKQVEAQQVVLREIQATTQTVTNSTEVVRCFDPEPELWYKKPTGNYILGNECSWCAYKKHCWPSVRKLPQIPSKAERPKEFWYTHVEEQKVDES